MASDYSFSIFTLLATVLYVIWFMASDYSFSIFTLLATVLYVVWFMASDYSFSNCKLFLTEFYGKKWKTLNLLKIWIHTVHD